MDPDATISIHSEAVIGIYSNNKVHLFNSFFEPCSFFNLCVGLLLLQCCHHLFKDEKLLMFKATHGKSGGFVDLGPATGLISMESDASNVLHTRVSLLISGGRTLI